MLGLVFLGSARLGQVLPHFLPFPLPWPFPWASHAHRCRPVQLWSCVYPLPKEGPPILSLPCPLAEAPFAFEAATS